MKAIKIFNDPVHGFIEAPKGLLVQLIDHPYFQRLRHIRQMGLASLVYASAVHSRFAHAMGAMHLTQRALKLLIDKGIEITDEELEGAQIAMLLHDIGHGPFSHALEHLLTPGLNHEEMSRLLMQRLNQEFDGKLTVAIQIFENNYHAKPFLHQLVSSQLDMDRIDYLMRDSFFTGVQEGIVGTDRIIKTLNVVNNQLVVEEKGVYSVEKFIIARRLMYWQVYLHRTALVAECMIVKILQRARLLTRQGADIWQNPALARLFLANELTDALIDDFVELDDNDVFYALKQWRHAPDFALSNLCRRIMDRRLLKLKFFDEETPPLEFYEQENRFRQQYGVDAETASHFVFSSSVGNLAYNRAKNEPIFILMKDGSLRDLLQASDMPNIQALSQTVVKRFFCYVRE